MSQFYDMTGERTLNDWNETSLPEDGTVGKVEDGEGTLQADVNPQYSDSFGFRGKKQEKYAMQPYRNS